MVRRAAAFLLCLAWAATAWAGSYQEYQQGNRAQREGRYAEAAAIFSRLIERDEYQKPYLAALHLNRGNAFLKMGREEKALKDYSRAVELNPGLMAAWFNRGNLFLQRGELEKALADFNRVLKAGPNNLRALTNRGWIHLVQGRYRQARKDLERASKASPEASEPRNNLGEVRLSLGDYEGARADFALAARLATEPRLAALALTNLGLAWAKQGRFRQAARAFSQALEKDPRYARAYYNRAAARERLGHLREALADMATFRRLAPNHPAGARDWAELKRRLASSRQQARQAAAALVRGRLPEEPVDWRAAKGRGLKRAREALAAQKKGDIALALDLYSLAVASGSLPPRALARVHNNRGLAWEQLGKSHRALSDFYMAVGLDPAYVDAFRNRAALWRKLGDTPKALADYDRAIDLLPDNCELLLKRAGLKAASGDPAGAEGDYDRALKLAPALARAIWGRALARERQGKLALALADAKAYVRLAPADKRGHRLLERLAVAGAAQRPREKSQKPAAVAR